MIGMVDWAASGGQDQAAASMGLTTSLMLHTDMSGNRRDCMRRLLRSFGPLDVRLPFLVPHYCIHHTMFHTAGLPARAATALKSLRKTSCHASANTCRGRGTYGACITLSLQCLVESTPTLSMTSYVPAG